MPRCRCVNSWLIVVCNECRLLVTHILFSLQISGKIASIASDRKEMEGPDLVKLFVGIGLSEIKAKETAKNTNVSANLKTCIDVVSKSSLFTSDIWHVVTF